MHFALLLSNLPHLDESRSHYEALLSLQPQRFAGVSALWQRLKALVS
jgi:hypothetical protein